MKNDLIVQSFIRLHLIIKPVLFLQRAKVLQAQGVFVIRHHEARDGSRGKPRPVTGHLPFDVQLPKTKTGSRNVTQSSEVFIILSWIFKKEYNI